MSNPSAKIPVIDSHHHLWDLDHNPYPGFQNPRDDTHLGDYRAICRNYLIDDLLQDFEGQNVVQSVHIEAGWQETDWEGETCWVQAVADRHGFPHAIVPNIDLRADDAAHRLEVLTSYANVRGVRSRFLSPSDLGKSNLEAVPSPLQDANWCANFRLLQRHGLSFDLQAPPQIMAMAADIAARFSETPFVLTHAGLPLDRSPEGLAFWREGMRLLAERDNVCVKISGLGMTDWHWTEDSLRPMVLESIDIFGPDRCMFGSNFPVDSLYATYDRLLTATRRIIKGFSEPEQQRILNGTARAFYRL